MKTRKKNHRTWWNGNKTLRRPNGQKMGRDWGCAGLNLEQKGKMESH